MRRVPFNFAYMVASLLAATSLASAIAPVRADTSVGCYRYEELVQANALDELFRIVPDKLPDGVRRMTPVRAPGAVYLDLKHDEANKWFDVIVRDEHMKEQKKFRFDAIVEAPGDVISGQCGDKDGNPVDCAKDGALKRFSIPSLTGLIAGDKQLSLEIHALGLIDSKTQDTVKEWDVLAGVRMDANRCAKVDEDPSEPDNKRKRPWSRLP
jgi:hypothetical protein